MMHHAVLRQRSFYVKLKIEQDRTDGLKKFSLLLCEKEKYDIYLQGVLKETR